MDKKYIPLLVNKHCVALKERNTSSTRREGDYFPIIVLLDVFYFLKKTKKKTYNCESFLYKEELSLLCSASHHVPSQI